jgi:hypothetical protein
VSAATAVAGTEDERRHRTQGCFAAVRSLYVLALNQSNMEQRLTGVALLTASMQTDKYTHSRTGITFFRQSFSSDETSGGLEWG